VGFARQFYNDQVQQFNTRIESVPTNIIANMFNFKQAEFFEIEVAAEREAPQVKF
jgi:LemA protein